MCSPQCAAMFPTCGNSQFRASSSISAKVPRPTGGKGTEVGVRAAGPGRKNACGPTSLATFREIKETGKKRGRSRELGATAAAQNDAERQISTTHRPPPASASAPIRPASDRHQTRRESARKLAILRTRHPREVRRPAVWAGSLRLRSSFHAGYRSLGIRAGVRLFLLAPFRRIRRKRGTPKFDPPAKNRKQRRTQRRMAPQ